MFGARKKQGQDPDHFWKEYEEQVGEKVLARSLGRYMMGWEEYVGPLWGLVIATSGGFRFHHFPHESWITALARLSSGSKAPVEKTIFVPKERISSVELHIEKRWWKRLFSPTAPLLMIHFDQDKTLYVEADLNASEIFAALQSLPQGGNPEIGDSSSGTAEG